MKTLRIVFMAWAACGMIVGSAAAFQEQSFQYAATHGMFEDMYDLFTDSPAYLASFEKNVIWSQLSNLRSRSDSLFGYNPADSLWQVGGTTDLIGPGRLGVMFDYGGYSEPVGNWRFYAPASHVGFGEGTEVVYNDGNGDNILDFRRERYSRSSAQDTESEGEVYLAYGLGLDGIDAGIGVRGSWSFENPTYTSTGFWMGDFSFDQAATQRDVDLITGQALYNYDFNATGDLNIANMEWGLVLAARSKDAFGIMPGLGTLVNLRPYIVSSAQDYNAGYTADEDFSPSDPGIISRWTADYQESGVASDNYPGNGFGVDGYIRADYPYAGVNWTGWINVESTAYSLQNADFKYEAFSRFENTDTFSGIPVYTSDTYTETTDIKNEGQGGFTWIEARLRGQIPLTGWRLGFGINGILSMNDNERTETITTQSVDRWDAGTGIPADSYTQQLNAFQKRRTTNASQQSVLQFPLAIVIDILKNFSVQVSAQYNIVHYSQTTTGEVLESPVPTTVRTYDDGTVVFDIPDTHETYTGDFTAEQTSYVETYFSTSFAYGLTWKPWEQVQIDLTGFTEPDRPGVYRASFCLYY